jgi:uncharacterized protein
MADFDYDQYISPCKNICRLDLDENYCIGCYRTKLEIKSWFRLTREEKLKTMEICKEREKTGFPKGFFN